MLPNSNRMGNRRGCCSPSGLEETDVVDGGNRNLVSQNGDGIPTFRHRVTPFGAGHEHGVDPVFHHSSHQVDRSGVKSISFSADCIAYRVDPSPPGIFPDGQFLSGIISSVPSAPFMHD
jgi:hypothetical protein